MGRLIPSGERREDGFTLIELLIALTLIAILASIAVPNFMHSTVRAREAALREDLFHMREAIDQYYADHGKYPDSLGAVVEKRYIRAVPMDPFTQSNQSWVEDAEDDGQGIVDVHSGSYQEGVNGIPYSEW